ncbi:trichohyalin-like [Pocillopora verrucosa]|uniref:trichohyalin-like n=1 Tax=Pocillopora verrucosa TaxID=203993 RepID=UPI003341D9A7
MAVKSNLGRCTRSRKTATNGGMSDDLENKPATRTLRSKKSVLLVSEKMDNCKVVIEKLKSDFVNTVRHAKIGRKRRRVESEDEAVIEEEEQEKEEKSTAKRTRTTKKKIEAKGEASSGRKQEVHYTSTREKLKAVLREPSPYSVSKSPIPRSLSTTKPSPEGKSPQQLASGAGSHLKMMRAPDDSSQEDSEIVIVKEDPVAFGSSKDKMLLTEKERGRRDIRDSATELNFRSQEHLSAEQLRKYQYHQQMLHFYLAYNSAAQAQLLSNMPPEQQMLYQQMLFEQEKQGMHSSSSSGHTETRTFEKKETQKPSDRTQDERRSDEVNKKAMPARTSPDESEFRRFPGKSESLPYPSSHGSSPKMTQHKLSSDEPPEKKSRVDEAYEREREMERLKYEKEEEYLQMQKQKQRMSMFKKLEIEMGGTFHKQQKTPEGSERRGNLSREEEKMENRSESGRDDEPPEKKSRVDEVYEREREIERLKYEKEEEYLQMQKQKQRMSMFKKLEDEMGGTFHKQQKTQ